MRTGERDMTLGNPARQIIGFALPVLGGMLFQYLYNFADTLIAGRFLGVEALAGMGAVVELTFIVIGFCNGSGSGFAVPVAQYFGSHNDQGMRRSFINGVYLVGAISLLMTALATYFCHDMVMLIKTPAESVAYAYEYQFIIFCGLPFLFFYNYFANIIRAVGNSRVPVMVLILTSIINVVLDYVLVVYVGMGVAGTAVATVFAQFVSAVICLSYILRALPRLRPTRRDMRPRMDNLGRCLSIGLPMGMQFSIMAIGGTVLQTSVNALGSAFLAAYTAAHRVVFAMAGPFDAVGMAMVSYSGQNMGAGKWDRISQGIRASFKILSCYSLIFISVIFFAGRFIIRLFVADAVDETSVTYAYYYMLVTAILSFSRMIIDVFRNTLQGTGYTAYTLLSGAGEMTGSLIMGLFVIPAIGIRAVPFHHGAAWLLANCLIVPSFLIARKKIIAQINARNNREAAAKLS